MRSQRRHIARLKVFASMKSELVELVHVEVKKAMPEIVLGTYLLHAEVHKALHAFGQEMEERMAISHAAHQQYTPSWGLSLG